MIINVPNCITLLFLYYLVTSTMTSFIPAIPITTTLFVFSYYFITSFFPSPRLPAMLIQGSWGLHPREGTQAVGSALPESQLVQVEPTWHTFLGGPLQPVIRVIVIVVIAVTIVLVANHNKNNNNNDRNSNNPLTPQIRGNIKKVPRAYLASFCISSKSMAGVPTCTMTCTMTAESQPYQP